MWYMGSVFLGLIGMSNLFGLQQWHKNYGWQEPDKTFGIILLIIAIGLYKYIDKVCDQSQTVKCKKCGEVFSEAELQNNKCSKCDGDVVDVHEYYETSNKNEETNTNPRAD